MRLKFVYNCEPGIRSLAENPGVAASTLARVVAEQDIHDLWQAKKTANLSKVRKIRFAANA